MTRYRSQYSGPTYRLLKTGSVACVLAGLVIAAGCQPKGDVEAASPKRAAQTEIPVTPHARAPQAEQPDQDKSARAASTLVLPSKSEAAAGGLPISIAGGWVNAGGACDSGASVFFNPDGTYLSEGEKGTWALSGKTLTVTTSSTVDDGSPVAQGPDESTGDSGEKSVLTLLSVTDAAARVVLSNGANANWTRCNS